MAVAALIKFVQGASTPPPGEALIGVLSTLVTASNGDNANVSKWEWEWFATPTGSAITIGIIASGNIPSISFTPDVRGTYVLVERVYDLLGNVSQDMRCFSVLEASGRLIPNLGADQAASNYGGQRRGWHPYIEAFLKAVDTGGFGVTVADEGGALGSFSGFNVIGGGIVAADAGGGIASLTVSSPTGTGLRSMTADVEDALAVLITDVYVDAAAGIAGSKINPDFGAQLVATTGTGAFGVLEVGVAPVAASGGVRFANSVPFAAARNFLNLADIVIGASDASDNLWIGSDAAFANSCVQLNLGGSFGYLLADAGGVSIYGFSGIIHLGEPVQGYNTPFGLHGYAVVDMLDADYAPIASEFGCETIEVGNGTPMTGDRALQLPDAIDSNHAYWKFIRNTNGGGFNVVVYGVAGFGGTTVSVADGFSAWVGVKTSGAFRKTADVAN